MLHRAALIAARLLALAPVAQATVAPATGAVLVVTGSVGTADGPPPLVGVRFDLPRR
ncbi:MAG: hypothetical protein Kow0013_13370 [Pararhodobacter sp.]